MRHKNCSVKATLHWPTVHKNATRSFICILSCRIPNTGIHMHSFSCHLHTEPPSPPRSVSLIPQPSSITVRWSAPSDNGGRTDLYYEVDISDPDNLGSYTGTVYLSGRSTSRTISGLRPFTQYCVRVTAHNGVSDQDPNGQLLRREEQCTRTLTAGTYIRYYNSKLYQTADSSVSLSYINRLMLFPSLSTVSPSI